MARLTRGSDFSVAYSKQIAQGAINATPAFTPLNRSSGKPKETIGYVQDDTVTTDYNGRQNIQDTRELTADLETSTAKQSIEFLIAAVHGTEVNNTSTATTFAALADGFTFSASAYAAISVGDGFWMAGFANPLINTFYIVGAKGASNKVTTTIAPAATEAAGASVTMSSRKTKNADTTTYYTLQRRTTDNSAAGNVSYMTTYDNIVDTLGIAINETGIIKTTINFRGEQLVPGNLLISGQTTGAIPSDTFLSAVQNVKGFYVDGISAICQVKSMGINVSNEYAGDDAAGCQRYYARGAFGVSGDLAVRSRIDNTLDWEGFYRNSTRKSIAVRLSHNATDETYIVITQAVITDHNQEDSASVVASHQVSYGGEGNATTTATVMVFRNWSV